MINLHELRIGNLVCLNRNTDKPWIRIDEDEMEVLCAARNYDWYDPIPLTLELLEKCGFVDSHIENIGGLYGIEIRKDFAVVWPSDGCTEGHNIHFPCKHLHQLQNLYFALSGEELNINL